MFRALFLGAVQGLTEFIPISSSGHLVLVPFVLGWGGVQGDPLLGIPFNVAVHLGTALAVMAYFRRDLVAVAAGAWRTLRRTGDPEDRAMGRLAVLLTVGSIPAGLAGLLLEDFFERLFATPPVAAALLMGTAALLLGGEALYRRQAGPRRDIEDLRVVDALIVGLFQALAIAPGISRSGATIVAGVGRRLSRDAAARFSFLLALPAIVGAGILQVPEFPPGTDWVLVGGAMATSAVFGFAAIAFLLRHLRTRTLVPFAVYCVLASVGGLAFWQLAG